MNASPGGSPTPNGVALPTRPAAAEYATSTSLTFLKPRLKKSLRPWAAGLARSGVTANQVTLTSLVGSIVVGVLLCVFAADRGLFAILPIWLAGGQHAR
jgi:CDP-diacylglycerol--glycerol-3-phosphate 3-phosphatidyltransferase